MEENETEIETALREVKEETNIDVDINREKKVVMHYVTDLGNDKEVVLFLAVPIHENIKVQESEIKTIKWVSIEEALKLLTYENSKSALKEILSL